MKLHTPDPAFTTSDQARANFRLAIKISLGFLALLWLIQLVSWGFDLDLRRFGVHPRELGGLPGILLAPLLHAGFLHLLANSAPLLVLGAGMLYLYPNSAAMVLPAVYLLPGIAVWLFGRSANHIGASGLIYGLVSYIFLAGLLRRDRRAIAASLLVYFLYGSVAWGMLPIRPALSWETHLAAAIVGAVMAVLLRRLDIPPRKRYPWEDEPEHPEQPEHAPIP